MLKKMLSGCLVAAALCMLAVMVLADEGEKVDLSLKFKKGQKLEYKSTSDITQTISGVMDMKMSISQKQSLLQEVLEVDEKGVANVQQKVTHVKVKQDSPQGKQEFDSSKKEDLEKAKNDTNLKSYAALVNKPFTFKIDPKGNIIEVKGYDKILEEAFKDDPMAEMLKDNFSNDQAKKMLQMSYGAFPKEKVSKGESWTSKGEFPAGGSATMKMELKYTLAGTKEIGKRTCAKIDIEMTDLKIEGQMAAMMKLSEKKGKGVIYFDLKEQIVIDNTFKMSLTMEMDNPMDPTEPGMKAVLGVTSGMKLKMPATEEGIPTEKLAAAEVVMVGKVVKTEEREGFSYWVVEVKKSLKGEISKEHVDVLAKEGVDLGEGDQCILVLKSGEREGRKLYELLTDKPNTFSDENVKKFEEALKDK